MSAGAIVLSPTEIHLMSDGIMSCKDAAGDWQVANRNTNKVKVINDECAVLWLGVGLKAVFPNLTECGRKPWEVAVEIQKMLKSFYSANQTELTARVMVAGFQERPVLYEISSHTALEIHPVAWPAGAVYAWAMLHGCKGNNPFPDFVGKYLRCSDNLGQVAESAFTETLQNHEDSTVGGATYHHWLERGKAHMYMHHAECGVRNASL